MSRNAFSLDVEEDTLTDTRVGEPSLYKVILLNDDFTPMDFVVSVLTQFFQKNEEEATRIMLNIHNQGAGLCGVFPREIAETKVAQVNQFSRQSGYPLKCTMEQA